MAWAYQWSTLYQKNYNSTFGVKVITIAKFMPMVSHKAASKNLKPLKKLALKCVFTQAMRFLLGRFLITKFWQNAYVSCHS